MARMDNPSSQSLYIQVAIFGLGNALAVCLALLLYNLWVVFSDFNDSILWAFLCSVALRPPKEWLVRRLDIALSANYSVAWALISTLGYPIISLFEGFKEVKGVLSKWRRHAEGILDQQERQRMKVRGNLMSKHTSLMKNVQASSSRFSAYAKAGLDVLQSRQTNKRRKKKSSAQKQASAKSQSTALLRWLLHGCVAWILFQWLTTAWSATLQLFILTLTCCLVLAGVPLLFFTTNWLGSAVLSPLKTPMSPFTQKRLDAASPTTEEHRGPAQLDFSSVGPRKTEAPPLTPPTRMVEDRGQDVAATDKMKAFAHHAFKSVFCPLQEAARWLDDVIRSGLRKNLNAIASLLLIVGILLGTVLLALFLSARVADEGRTAVYTLRNCFPSAWANAAVASLAFLDLNPDGTDSVQLESHVTLPPWLANYQKDAVDFAQRSLPGVAHWVDVRLADFVQANNLTSAVTDIQLILESLQGPRKCSSRTKEKRVVEVARAEVAAAQAASVLKDTEEAVDVGRRALSEAMKESEEVSGRKDDDKDLLLEGKRLIIEMDEKLNVAKEAHHGALILAEETQRRLHSANVLLALCVDDMSRVVGGSPERSMLLPGWAGVLGTRLQSAYSKLWRGQVREGIAEIKLAATYVSNAVKSAAQPRGGGGGGGGRGADLNALQRLAGAIAEPLLAVGRLLAISLGSSAAAAFMGGLGVLRLGIGVVKAGLQLTLFLALLYYLLAADRDPILHAANVLPLSEVGRKKVVAALNHALGGVLSSMMKLVFFHVAWSWLIHSVLDAPLVYATSVASGVSALLPFVPTPVVATPAIALLVFYRKRPIAGFTLALAQLWAYWHGDTVILQDVGHAYLMSLGILGGLYAFENPLQGCILGPILLSLLSVFYELHREFMGGQGGKEFIGVRTPKSTPLTVAVPSAQEAVSCDISFGGGEAGSGSTASDESEEEKGSIKGGQVSSGNSFRFLMHAHDDTHGKQHRE